MKNNLVLRTITGIGYVGLVVGSILLSPVAFAMLFFLITLLGLLEFYKMMHHGNVQPQKVWGAIVGLLYYVIITLAVSDLIPMMWLWTGLLFLFSIFIAELYRKKERPFANIGATILGFLYVVLPFALLNFFFKVPQISDSYQILLGFFIILWTNDTFAYIIGVTIGKHKFFERLSPKKTWEGSIGGALMGLLAAWVLYNYCDSFTLIQWLTYAVVIIIFGTLGDLSESQLKRSQNCKDSGDLLPGHGGILDRLDSVILASPFAFFYILLIGL
ncbi:MAG: phosphatidate cytidylyltransferase [Bacteroidales bacterium]|nr:phosphatidate cytidylyltransferase [Bacteroidales bacterium]